MGTLAREEGRLAGLEHSQVRSVDSAAEQIAVADRAAITVFRVITPNPAGQLLSCVVSRFLGVSTWTRASLQPSAGWSSV